MWPRQRPLLIKKTPKVDTNKIANCSDKISYLVRGRKQLIRAAQWKCEDQMTQFVVHLLRFRRDELQNNDCVAIYAVKNHPEITNK
jgi:hypothetical protein